MKAQTQRGIALILVMVLLFVLSVMAVSMLFLAQTETWSSLNYRLMTQARYGAEAGAEKAINFLLNSYTAPTTSGSDLLSSYANTTWSSTNPTSLDGDQVGVTYGGNAVVLSSVSGQANYPVSTVQTNFKNAVTGSFAAGNSTVNYSAHAVLLAMQQVTPFGSPNPTGVQTWRITGDATISGAAGAQVEVSTIIERQVFPRFTYAAFTTSAGCNSLQFGGSAGSKTGSYDDSVLSGGVPTTSNSGGNVGTNGNLDISGANPTINGTLSSAQPGSTTNPPATCTAGSVTAYIGHAGNVTGGLVPLPQKLVYPPPVIPAPGSNNISLSQATCPTGAGAVTGCTVGASPNNNHDIMIPPGSYGNIQISGQVTLHLQNGIYNINSFTMTGNNVTLVVDSSPPGPVILNVSGTNALPTGITNVVTLSGNSLQNPSYDPNNFQIQYAGTGTVQLAGGTKSSGLLYAPSATFSFTGGSSWYGAVIGATMTDMGGTGLFYDRRLANDGSWVSNPTLTAFTWKKY